MGASIDAADANTSGGEGRAPAAIEVRLGKGLSASWQTLKPLLSERIAALRSQHETASGFAFPAVVFQDGAELDPNGYEIALFGNRHAYATIYPDKTLALGASETKEPLSGIQARDPAFGLPGFWIEQDARDKAVDAGFTLVDPITVLMTHLGEVLRNEAPLLITRADVVALLEGVRNRQPGLVEELMPALLTVSDVQRILQNLVSEDVAIRNVDQICEALVDLGRQTKDHAELTELVRQRLSHSICHGLRGQNEQLSVLSLSPRIEARVMENIRRSDGKSPFVI